LLPRSPEVKEWLQTQPPDPSELSDAMVILQDAFSDGSNDYF
jgi:hypothetical protein